MTTNHTVQAVFSLIPTVLLTVGVEHYVAGWGYEELNANIYVDGNLFGTGMVTISVSQGQQHTISVENPYGASSFVCFGNYVWNGSSYVFSAYSYTDPQTLTINQQSDIIAYYYP